MYGRNVLLLPERRGARRGVEIVMLTPPRAGNRQVTRRSKSASPALLEAPLGTFTLE